MILDTTDNLERYEVYGERFQIAIAYIKRVLSGEEELREHVELKGQEVYASAQENTTTDERKWEAHKKYIDLQLVLEGEEWIDYAPVSLFPPEAQYLEDYDFLIAERVEPYTCLHLYPGYFGIFFPEDGHRPNGAGGAPSKVRKLVVKIAV